MPIARKAKSEMAVYAEHVKTDVVDVDDLTIIISAIGVRKGVFGHTLCVATADTMTVWSARKTQADQDCSSWQIPKIAHPLCSDHTK